MNAEFLLYISRDGNFPGRAGTKNSRDGPGQGMPGNPGNGTFNLIPFFQQTCNFFAPFSEVHNNM